MKIWKNEKGETCIGSRCFHVRASGEDVVVHYNSTDPSCNKDVGRAVESMFELISKGGVARFQRRKE